jgi:hypothetical protein
MRPPAEKTELVYAAADEMDLARATAFLSGAGIEFQVQRLTYPAEPEMLSAGTWMTTSTCFHGGVYARVFVLDRDAAWARDALEAMVAGEMMPGDMPESGDDPSSDS